MAVRNQAGSRRGEFMEWLDHEVARRGGEREVEALVNEMMLEEQLADLRKKRGLSQAKLAKLVGVSQPVIARIESGGVRNLTVGTIARTAAALGGRVEIKIRLNRHASKKRKAKSA